MRALRRRCKSTFAVVMQDPKTGLGTADMIWVPEHDRLRGKNVFTTLTAPHSFTPSRLAELRAQTPLVIGALPHPRVAVMLGGKNAVYKFREEDDALLIGALQSLGDLGASFLVTPSRRSISPCSSRSISGIHGNQPCDAMGWNPRPTTTSSASANNSRAST